MKRKEEKADIVKRKVFHEHIILLTEGRFLMLAVLDGVAPVSLCAGQNGRNDAGMVGDTFSPAGRGVVVLRTASSVLVQMLWVPCGHGG